MHPWVALEVDTLKKPYSNWKLFKGHVFSFKGQFLHILKERIEERCLEAALFLILILDVEESSAFLVAIMLSLNDQWLMLGIGH